MAEYRISRFTLEQRTEAALRMLDPERTRGVVTELAHLYGVSRTLLYEIQDRAREVLGEALLPRPAGRPAESGTVKVDKGFVDRAIAVLPLLKGSVRDIGMGLDLLLGVSRSVGYISQTLAASGEIAATYNRGITVPLAVLGEADEIFQGRQPCLTVVDGRSFLVLNLTPAQSRDATTWGVTYLDLVARGIQFQDLACDGGTGLRAGVKEAKLAIPLLPDLFHLLQDAHRVTQRLERMAYKAIESAERARRADLEDRGLVRRRGRRLKVHVPLLQAERQETHAIATLDGWCWLLGIIRQALEPITPTGRLVSVSESKATVETAIALLKQLGHPDITTFADDLHKKLPEVLAPLAWLEQQLAPLLQDVAVDWQTFLLWAWQHRSALALNIDTDIPEDLHPVARTLGDALALFHRSSSLAELLHSWLRPYLQIHRGMPKWLLPLLQLFWNHHSFQRGKRTGRTPLQLAGVADAPSLAEALDQLFRPNLTAHLA